jgi:nicotinate-nucleotide adenylyltransferase
MLPARLETELEPHSVSPSALTSSHVLPVHAPGLRVGLLGGSFNPPHAAHRAISLFALKRLKLDRVWWLVTPGNPLKDTSKLAPLAPRIAAARRLTHHPRIDVTGLEAVIKTRYTYDTIKWLIARCPGVHFVWIMGADNLRSFHRWQKWRGIAKLVPFAVVDRLGPSLYAAASPAGQALSRARIAEHEAASLPFRTPPAWTFIHGLKSPLSSTALRAMRRLAGTVARSEPSAAPAKKKVGKKKSSAKSRSNKSGKSDKSDKSGKSKKKPRENRSQPASRHKGQKALRNAPRAGARVERSGVSHYLGEEPRANRGGCNERKDIKL